MRNRLLILAIVAVAMVMAACFSEGPTATPTSPPPSPTEQQPTPSPTPLPPPSAAPLATVEVVKKVVPSVVNILTESVQLDMFRRRVPTQGAGTGIVYDTQGHIVTNNHVVAGAQQITVTLADGRSFPARLVGGDLFSDLAIVRIEAPDLVPSRFGDSAALQVGEDVVAIGHALNLPGGPTVTKGVVSAKERTLQVSDDVTLEDLIQTDAPINPGNSGGPLVNMRGEVVGINSAGIQQAEGLGFAIGANAARPVIQDLIAHGNVQRAVLGIQPVSVTPALARRFGLAVTRGIIVAEVVAGSPAAADLRQGDVIVDIGGAPIATTTDLIRVLGRRRAGEPAAVTFYRDKAKRTVTVTFAGPQ